VKAERNQRLLLFLSVQRGPRYNAVWLAVVLLIDIRKSEYRTLDLISVYENTHTIIENGVQTVRVYAVRWLPGHREESRPLIK